MRLGSLFAGIGGFELAAREVGWTPIWSNEIDAYCCKVLRKNFTHEIIEEDIREIGKQNLEPVDIITGGFPCQPFSAAGKRNGQNDNRYLWPEMLRIIQEIRPSYVVAENVLGLLSIEGGMVFEDTCSSMEAQGYEVQALVLPAVAVNAPHRRDRVWIVAHNEEWANRKHNTKSKKRPKQESGKSFGRNNIPNTFRQSYEGIHKGRGGGERVDMEQDALDKSGREQSSNSNIACSEDVANSDSFRQPKQGKSRRSSHTKKKTKGEEHRAFNDLLRITQPPVRGRDDGFSRRMDRNRLKGLGNAIVPQVAYEIFKAIDAMRNKPP